MTPYVDHTAFANRAGLSSALPREYVHKSAHSEVLLTGWKTEGPDTFTVTAQWPRTHAFYAPTDGRHDPLLLAETVRQAVPLLSHVAYDVPFGHRQIWNTFSFALDPDALAVGATPAEVDMHVRCTDVTRRAGRLHGLTMHVELTRDGAPLGTAEAAFTNQPPHLYQRLRGPYADTARALSTALPAPSPLPPHHVDRDRRTDVVLAPTPAPHRTQLRIDPTHPVLFDHPVDHAPGMLLIEAARQAAHHTTPDGHPTAVLTGLHTTFHRYIELDAPCYITTRPTPAHTVEVQATQNDHLAFAAAATLTPRTT
ncbi:ScbA/BarX family gamma-butyrolactone biosynthesis protein [Streptomyces roseolus]|uniref:ScbA/BarX family gamma-butyrolactone biosynthesis protein n=1 Tax=Streptomyces roseolus TaxID=67358 RepID=UPI00369B6BD2